MTGDAALRPWEIRKFTMPEIALLLDSAADKPGVPEGAVIHNSHEEKLAWFAQRRRMTIKQRLEEAKREVRGHGSDR